MSRYRGQLLALFIRLMSMCVVVAPEVAALSGCSTEDDDDSSIQVPQPLQDDDDDGYPDCGGGSDESQTPGAVADGPHHGPRDKSMCDCDDSDAAVYPDAIETCNGHDDNCDEITDEGFDQDADGYSTCATPIADCADDNNLVHPGASEICSDEIDNDCDTETDEADCIQSTTDADGDGYPVSTDCNDSAADANTDGIADGYNIHPGAPENCNGIDDNCDGRIDEELDTDEDGYTPCGSDTAEPDCDDAHSSVHPGADEACNEVDDDCDGEVDEGETAYYRDADSDGFGDPESTPVLRTCETVGYVDNDSDCDDSDASVNPEAVELCDNIDNNCSGETDEDGLSILYADADNDGYGDALLPEPGCDAGNADGVAAVAGDCDDVDAAVNPAAEEICDGIDNDCDELSSDPTTTYYRDADSDSYGTGDNTVSVCAAPEGYVLVPGDCNDGDPNIYPLATEIPADGVDQNCDTLETCYVDTDLDSYGSAELLVQDLTCSSAGLSNVNGDCDDDDHQVYPSAEEICDGLDNDCDGLVDSDDGDFNPDEVRAWYPDNDGDGYGTLEGMQRTCAPPSGYVTDFGDCDDSDSTSYPGATELCDGIDNDCDSEIDNNPGTEGTVYYPDQDGDGYGDTAGAGSFCAQPDDYTSTPGDCDDLDGTVYPSATEVCDTVDNDCDDSIDEGYDVDQDGFTTCANDCDDDDGDINPGVEEVCNDLDDNCDGFIDEGYDVDGDLYTTCEGDCDDAEAEAYPGAEEIFDGLDNDCDGTADEDPYESNDTLETAAAVSLPFETDDLTLHVAGDHDYFSFTVSGNIILTVDVDAQAIGSSIDSWAGLYTSGGVEITHNDDYNGLDSLLQYPLGIGTYYVMVRDLQEDDVDFYDLTLSAASDPDNDGDDWTVGEGDCNDSNASIYPGAAESCNYTDDDCDGSTDEGVQTTYYLDADQDGYGGTTTTTACTQPSGYVGTSTDCNDGAASIHPGATEACNGVDDDCDESIPSNEADADRDGYKVCANDCDDGNADIRPGLVEVCDGVDTNCSNGENECTLVGYIYSSPWNSSYPDSSHNSTYSVYSTGELTDEVEGVSDWRSNVAPWTAAYFPGVTTWTVTFQYGGVRIYDAITIGMLVDLGEEIYQPDQVEISYSTDGATWTDSELFVVGDDYTELPDDTRADITLDLAGQGKYTRIVLTTGANVANWIFLDEVGVQ